MDAHETQTIGTFVRGALNYWIGVYPRVHLHLGRWRRRAARIPDPQLRRLAHEALDKDTNIEGAAAFAAFVPWRRRARVTLACSSFQAAYNYLDMLAEQPSADPIADGRRLHEALLSALDPHAPTLDWYEHHPQREDGGYLQEIIDGCRHAFMSLPAYPTAVAGARAAAERIVAFQSLNLSEAQGDHAGLRAWALQATPADTDLQWWETAASAGSSLGVLVLIAAAARPGLKQRHTEQLAHTYFPWVGALHSLLDNLVDKHEDDPAGQRSFVDYYDSQAHAAQRMRWLSQQSLRSIQTLTDGRAHQVILAAMIGNYLSTPAAHTPQLLSISQAVLDTMGPLRRPTMLVFGLRNLLAGPRKATDVGHSESANEHSPSALDNFG